MEMLWYAPPPSRKHVPTIFLGCIQICCISAELKKLTRSFGADLGPASKICRLWGPSVPKRLTRSRLNSGKETAGAAIANPMS